MEEEVYTIESIKNKKTEEGEVYYLIKWLGYDKPEDMTWEPL